MSKISIDIASGKVRKDSGFVVGIDLGTTNSLVAIYRKEDNEPMVLRGQSGGHVITPSVLHLDPKLGFVVGEAARQKLKSDPTQTVYSVKRLMGKSYKDISDHESYFGYKVIDEDEDSLVKIQLGDKFYSPIELSAEILKELKRKAESTLKASVDKAVITVPAYFNDSQRQATRDAGKLAGLEVLRIVNEPTAASLAYGLNRDNSEENIIAVYDLGGGTFDISILQIEEGVFEVLSTHGDTYLGGDDIDRAIVEHWFVENSGLKEVCDNPAQRAAIRLEAEEAKKTLSSQDLFQNEFEKFNLKLDKQQLSECMKPILEKTLKSCEHAVKDSGLERSEIKEVVLVGGSTKSPQVESAVRNFFPDAHLNNQLNPDEVVALGAAIEADILAGNRKDMLLLDVTPLSLGIETMGGLMDVIIPRNSKVPSSVGRNYTTSIDGQVNLKVSVYQGERDQVEANRKLAEFVLSGIPAMPAGLPKIEITFMINADGILKVKAKELRSGVEQQVDIKPSYGLTDEQVEEMLMASLKNAQTDMDFRALKEASNEAAYLITSSEKFLQNHSQSIQENEQRKTESLIQSLKKAITSQKKDEILKAHDALSEYTKPFAEKMMDETISKALSGKSIEN